MCHLPESDRFAPGSYLAFLEAALNCSNEGVSFIHPSYWMFTQKDTKSHLLIKEAIQNYKKDFILFNGNGIFNIGLFMPCVISIINKTVKCRITHSYLLFY